MCLLCIVVNMLIMHYSLLICQETLRRLSHLDRWCSLIRNTTCSSNLRFLDSVCSWCFPFFGGTPILPLVFPVRLSVQTFYLFALCLQCWRCGIVYSFLFLLFSFVVPLDLGIDQVEYARDHKRRRLKIESCTVAVCILSWHKRVPILFM